MCYCSEIYTSVMIGAWLTLVELIDIHAPTSGSVEDGWSMMALAGLAWKTGISLTRLVSLHSES